MEQKGFYRDSRNYAPIDVAKGMDLKTKMIVNADDMDPNFVKLPKCKHCVHFEADKEKIELGICKMSTSNPKFMAYPDMVAVTCEDYKE